MFTDTSKLSKQNSVNTPINGSANSIALSLTISSYRGYILT